jgi:hypothetical protein
MAKVLAKVSFTTSENDPELRVTKAVADYYSLHRNLRLDSMNGKPKNAVEHLVSMIRPATLQILIESVLPFGPISRSSYVDDNSCLLVSSVLPLLLHDVFASRHLHI